MPSNYTELGSITRTSWWVRARWCWTSGTIGASISLRFPYGDFKRVHRCAILAAESRAGQYKHFDIENAVAHLHGMMEALKPARR